MKPGDFVEALTEINCRGGSIEVGARYQIQRVRGSYIMLSYEDGFVPRNLRNAWFSKSWFKAAFENRPEVGSVVELISLRHCEDIGLIIKRQIKAGDVAVVLAHHPYDRSLVRLRLENGVRCWFKAKGLCLHTKSKIPVWF